MEVIFYKNSSERNTINKKITQIGSTDVLAVKGQSSILNPTLLLITNLNEMLDSNYIYIAEWKRYYYIDDVIIITGGRYELHCSVDVLESFKKEILNLTCIIDKQDQTNYNKYKDDGSFVTENRVFNTVISFNNGFNDSGEYILITAGG